MIRVRRASERGRTDWGWLDSRHTFSFGEYHDPAYVGFRSLRVINDDRVRAGEGFGTHPHRDMEILSYVVEGALEHRDSTGSGSVIRPGEVQIMSAGTGIAHSERNPSRDEPVHFLQIWILPERKGLEPRHDQRAFPIREEPGRLHLVAARGGRDGALAISQDVAIHAGLLGEGDRAALRLEAGRAAWVQVARGSVALNGTALEAGDGAALSDEVAVELEGREEGEVLVFDLA